jgi:hypothetical protein
MKVLLDCLGMDRLTKEDLKKLGAKLNFYKGLPEMFEEFRGKLLTEEHIAHGTTVEQQRSAVETGTVRAADALKARTIRRDKRNAPSVFRGSRSRKVLGSAAATFSKTKPPYFRS